MNIRSSTTLRNEYNKIAAIAKETEEPVYITQNGNGDTVLMGIRAFEKPNSFLRLEKGC